MPDENTNPEIEDTSERGPFEDFLYHQRRALEETGKALEALLPEGFRVHGTNASKEFSRGFRVLMDAAMDELKQASKKVDTSKDNIDTQSTTGKTKVKVEVD